MWNGPDAVEPEQGRSGTTVDTDPGPPSALALGVPVLATRVGGLPELVLDDVTGFTCAPGEAVSFASVLRELLDDPERLAALRQRAREFAEARLDQRAMHSRYEEALRGLMARDT